MLHMKKAYVFLILLMNKSHIWTHIQRDLAFLI